MTLNRLADTSLPAVELDRAFNPECSRVIGVSSNAHNHEPLFISSCSVTDNLSACEVGVAVENFDWRRSSVCHGPVPDRGFRNETNRVGGEPRPVDHILVHDMRLDFLLHLNVEDL